MQGKARQPPEACLNFVPLDRVTEGSDWVVNARQCA
jgi:hypothetical protein